MFFSSFFPAGRKNQVSGNKNNELIFLPLTKHTEIDLLYLSVVFFWHITLFVPIIFLQSLILLDSNVSLSALNGFFLVIAQIILSRLNRFFASFEIAK